MRCQGKLPSLASPLAAIASAWIEEAREDSKEGRGCIEIEAGVMGWVDREKQRVDGREKKHTKKIQTQAFDQRSNLNSNFRERSHHCCYNTTVHTDTHPQSVNYTGKYKQQPKYV